MTTREALHQLVDCISSENLEAARRALEPFADPLLVTLANAPIDDEPETEEERAAVAEGLADLDAGRSVTLEELRREFGL